MIDEAIDVNDLNVPPASHLEKLTADRSDQYSIRVNKQYRICFVWNETKADDVEIVDYH